uniref:Uncharacterized protein n=1 Tax=Rhizophora mucronata TaxID=61149 RepID=A0A2P2NGT5_RHIMU
MSYKDINVFTKTTVGNGTVLSRQAHRSPSNMYGNCTIQLGSETIFPFFVCRILMQLKIPSLSFF